MTTLVVLRADSSANTFGWDTVFAIRVSDANAQLARTAADPTSFSGQQDDIAISGTFAPWRARFSAP